MRAALTVLVLCAVTPVRADEASDRAAAAKLFQDGRALITAGKIDEACVKFESSFKLDPAIGTKLNLADCLERKGLLAAAYRLFDEAAVEAAKTSKEGRHSFARQRADGLAAKLVRVELAIAEPATPGMVVTIAGIAVASDAWTEPRFLAPGPIAVDVTAPGRTPFRAELDGRAGATQTVAVPALAAAARGGGPVGHGARGITSGGDTPRRPSRKLAYIVGGGGVALIGGSVALGLAARSKYRGAACGERASLPEGLCTPAGQDTTDSARRLADVGTGFAIAGAVAVGVGVYLFLRARPSAAADHVLVTPAVSDDAVGVVVTFLR